MGLSKAKWFEKWKDACSSEMKADQFLCALVQQCSKR